MFSFPFSWHLIDSEKLQKKLLSGPCVEVSTAVPNVKDELSTFNSPPPSFFQNAVVSQGENGNATDSHGVENNLGVDQPPKVPSDMPNTRIVPNPDSIAPGR